MNFPARLWPRTFVLVVFSVHEVHDGSVWWNTFARQKVVSKGHRREQGEREIANVNRQERDAREINHLKRKEKKRKACFVHIFVGASCFLQT